MTKKGAFLAHPIYGMAVQTFNHAKGLAETDPLNAKTAAAFEQAISLFELILPTEKNDPSSANEFELCLVMAMCHHYLGTIMQMKVNARYKETKDQAYLIEKLRGTINAYLKGIKILEERVANKEGGIEYLLRAINFYADLASAYSYIEDFENAKKYYKKAIDILKAAKKREVEHQVLLEDCISKHDEACHELATKYTTEAFDDIDDSIKKNKKAEQAIKDIQKKEIHDYHLLVAIRCTIIALYTRSANRAEIQNYTSLAVKVIKKIPENQRNNEERILLLSWEKCIKPSTDAPILVMPIHTRIKIDLPPASPDLLLLAAVERNDEGEASLVLQEQKNNFSNETVSKALLLAMNNNSPAILDRLFNISKLTITDFLQQFNNTDVLRDKQLILANIAFFYLRKNPAKPEDSDQEKSKRLEQINTKANAIAKAIFLLHPVFNKSQTSNVAMAIVLLDSPSTGVRMQVTLQDIYKIILAIAVAKEEDLGADLTVFIQEKLYAPIRKAEEAKTEAQRAADLDFYEGGFAKANQEYQADLNYENKENPASSRLREIKAKLDSLQTLLATIEQRGDLGDYKSELLSLKKSLQGYDSLHVCHKNLGERFNQLSLKIKSRSASSSGLKEICEDYTSYKENLSKYELTLQSVAERLKVINASTKQQVSTVAPQIPDEKEFEVGTGVQGGEANAVPETKLAQTQAQHANADKIGAKANFEYLRTITNDQAYFPSNLLLLSVTISNLCCNVLQHVESDISYIRNRKFFVSPALENLRKQQAYCRDLLETKLPNVRKLYSQFDPNFQTVKANISAINDDNLLQNISLLKNMETLFERSYLTPYSALKTELEAIKKELQAIDPPMPDFSADPLPTSIFTCMP